MSTSQEAPALIQYACERCKTRFVLPPSSRKLSIAGKFKAFSSGLSRTFRYHEGLGSSYDTARRQLLAKMDDEAYQSFVQSFRFCHECRQFVCNECWSTSRRSCLTCVAKSMTGTARPRPPFAPTGPEIPRPAFGAATAPRKGRLRRDATVVALGLAIVLLVVEGGVLLFNATSPGSGTIGQATATPTVGATPTLVVVSSPTDTPFVAPSITIAPTMTPTPAITDTPVPSATATATATTAAGPTATPRPIVTVPPAPIITCGGSRTDYTVAPQAQFSCVWINKPAGWTATWHLDAGTSGNLFNTVAEAWQSGDSHSIFLKATRSGWSTMTSNSVLISVS